MSTGTVVLVAEDEPAIADLLELYLAREGYAVHVVRDGAEVTAAVSRLRPAALVMDIGLPNVDGIAVCRALREAGDWTPVLFVTARDDEVDRIVGLEIGADDYITKPFSPREVVSRVKAVLRRAAAADLPGRVLAAGGVRLDADRRTVHTADGDVALTATEFDLLAHLMRHRRQVLRREQLLAEVWGYASEVTTRTVDVHVAQVRAKLGDASPIRTVRGVGYVVD
ncbi:MAG: response regulator [Sporichthyaceae bacterium]